MTAVAAPDDDERRRAGPIEPRQDGRRMMTVPEVGAYIRSSDDHVRKLINRGLLPAAQRMPRKTLVCEADLWAFLFGNRA